MGSWNNPVMVQEQPGFLESTVLPTMTSLMAGLVMAKVKHNWDMDAAEIAAKTAKSAEATKHQRDIALKRVEGDEDRKTAIERKIASGDLVRVPDTEMHHMRPEQAQQLVRRGSEYYAVKPKEVEKTKIDPDKHLLSWLKMKQAVESGDETQIQTVYKILALQKGVAPGELQQSKGSKDKLLDIINKRVNYWGSQMSNDPAGIL